MWIRRALRPAVSALRSLFGLDGVADATWAIRDEVQRIIDAQRANTAAVRADLRRVADAQNSNAAAIAGIVEQLSNRRAKIVHLEERHEEVVAGIDRFPLDQAPRMQMATDWPAADVERLWNHVAATWTNLGASDPYFSVSTFEEYRIDQLDAEGIERFFASSEHDIDRMHSWFRRHDRPVPLSGVIAEYGCGVGRSTPIFARQFSRVKAFDISGPHLRMCWDRLDSLQVRNTELIHISDFRSLERLTSYDVFYSCIVLQHNPPPLIAAIVRQALHGLNPGGFAFFQVPTYCRGYCFDLEKYVARIHNEAIGTAAMEMHLLPQETIFRIIAECDCTLLEVQPDYCVGSYGDWISNTFFVQKH